MPSNVLNSGRIRPSRRWLIRGGVMVLAVLSSAGSGAQVIPLGPPIQVDVTAATPRVAVDPRGRFGVLWAKEGVHAGVLQSFDSEGRVRGPRRLLADPDPQRSVFTGDLAVDGFGGFLATWWDRDVYDERPALYARFFDFGGAPRTGVIELAGETTGGYHQLGGAARNRRGEAIVVWTTRDFGLIRARRFDSREKPVGPPFNIRAATPGGYVADPDVAIDDLGRFVVAWRESGLRGVDRFFFQRYDRDGRRRGGIRTLTGEHVLRIAVEKEAGGEFVAVWDYGDSASFRVLARWFDAFGRPLTDTVVIRASGEFVADAAVTRDRFGNTIVVWWRSHGASAVVEGRMYDRLGVPLGPVFRVGRGFTPSAGIDDDGHLVVAWGITDGMGRPRPAYRRFRVTCGPGYESRCPD